MADNATYKTIDMDWASPMYDDGEGLVVIGWRGMDVHSEYDGSWDAVPAANSDGEELLLAVPSDIVKAWDMEHMSDSDVWNLFISLGGDWGLAAKQEAAMPEKKGRMEFQDMLRKMGTHESIDIGERCMDDFNRWLGPSSILDAAREPYERFIRDIPDIVRENADFMLSEHGGITVPSRDVGTLSPEQRARIKWRISVSNPRLEMSDPGKAWNELLENSVKSHATATHSLIADISISEFANGEWKVVDTSSRRRIADIPAMNMDNGLFLVDGKEYAMATIYDNRRFVTGGMFLRMALAEGIRGFGKEATEKASSIGLSDQRNRARTIGSIGLQSGFDDMYLNKGPAGESWRYVEDENVLSRRRSALTVLFREPEESGGTRPRADVTMRFHGIVDNSIRPEGRNITKKACLTYGVRIDDEGIPRCPFYEVKDRKIDRSRIVWKQMVPIFDEEGSPIGDPQGELISSSVLVLAGDVREDGTFFDKDKGTIPVKIGDSMRFARPEEIRYATISPIAEYGVGSTVGKERTGNNPTRAAINSSNEKMALTVAELSGSPSGFYEPGLVDGEITRALFDGTVVAIDTRIEEDGKEHAVRMSIEGANGERQEIDLREKSSMNGSGIRRETPCKGLAEGSRVRKGMAVTDNANIVDGECVFGSQALVALMPAGMEGTDDSILISREFASAMRIEYRETREFELLTGDATSPFGPTLVFNPTIGKESSMFAGYDCSNLGPDGLVKDGTIVKKGDILAYAMVPDGTRKREPGEQIAMQRPIEGTPFTEIPSDYKLHPLVLDKAIEGDVKAMRETLPNGRTRLSFSVHATKPLEPGDKISMNGVKGTVVVLDEGEGLVVDAPGTAMHGKVVDVMVSGLGFFNRQAPMIPCMGLINASAYESSRKMLINPQSRNLMQGTAEALSRAGLPDDGRLRVVGTLANGRVVDGIEVCVCSLPVMVLDKLSKEALGNEGKALSAMDDKMLEANGMYEIYEDVSARGKTGSIDDKAVSSVIMGAGYGIVDAHSVKRKPKQRRPDGKNQGLSI